MLTLLLTESLCCVEMKTVKKLNVISFSSRFCFVVKLEFKWNRITVQVQWWNLFRPARAQPCGLPNVVCYFAPNSLVNYPYLCFLKRWQNFKRVCDHQLRNNSIWRTQFCRQKFAYQLKSQLKSASPETSPETRQGKTK